MTEKIVIQVPKPKRRAGVMPTKREVDKSKKHPRQEKHKKRGQEYGGPPG